MSALANESMCMDTTSLPDLSYDARWHRNSDIRCNKASLQCLSLPRYATQLLSQSGQDCYNWPLTPHGGTSHATALEYVAAEPPLIFFYHAPTCIATNNLEVTSQLCLPAK